MNMDAPTETQFDIPVQNRMNRDVVKSLAECPKWSSKIMAVLIAGSGIRAYVARSGLCGGGGNLSATCLYLALMATATSGCVFGTIYKLVLDNTGADNKNFLMICFLSWLVLSDVFEEASFFCMQKGHTYSSIDQCFRTLIRQLLGEAIWTVGSLINFIFQFLAPYNCLSVQELPHVWNWHAFFEPHLHQKIKGFATGQYGPGMHEIIVRKDREGVVRVWFRSSSQASNWIPEGEGYPVFKTVPEGQPPIAPGRLDRKWKRYQVQDTVRRWFRFMSVDQSQAKRIRDDWEKRFRELPPDGDFSSMRDVDKLEWMDLPKQMPRRPMQFNVQDAQVSRTLENPPINPITGHGRTAADVQRERDAYQREMRDRAAGRGERLKAIFQADFLFVRLPEKGVQLHRVANGLFIQDAMEEKLSFTTVEYAHTPQEDVDGFWGTFEPALNPTYDPTDNKSGTMYARHHNMGRDVILVYDVQVTLVQLALAAHLPMCGSFRSVCVRSVYKTLFVCSAGCNCQDSECSGWSEGQNCHSCESGITEMLE